MKFKAFLIIALFLAVNWSYTCKSPSEPSIIYSLADLVGNWTGTAKKTNITLNLNLKVNAAGEVTNSGISATWSIDIEGKVTGDGRVGMIVGSSYVSSSCSWSMQMSSDKKKLTGSVTVNHPDVRTLSVDLTKQ